MELQLCKDKYWYFRLVNTKNKQVILTSETYYSKWNAKRQALKLVRVNGFRYREVR